MKIITLESNLAKHLIGKLNEIEKFIKENTIRQSEDDVWVDNYEVCTFLQISERTLQRLRQDGLIEYSIVRGKAYYKIGEIKRMLSEKLIKRDESSIISLINSHKLYVEQRKNIRKDK